MSKKSGKRRGGGNTIVASIISALIGAAATIVAAVVLARFSPGTVIQFVNNVGGDTGSIHTSSGSASGSAPVQSAISQPEWLVEADPITKEGVWTVEQAEVGGSNYTHSWTGSTGSGDNTDTSWIEFGIPDNKTQLSGLVGVQDGGHNKNKAQFVVEVDGQEVLDIEREIGDKAEPFSLDISGADNLRLQVTDTSGTAYSADGVFADIEMK